MPSVSYYVHSYFYWIQKNSSNCSICNLKNNAFIISLIKSINFIIMTVSYSEHVFTSTSNGIFLKLLFRWKGSIYKLVWRDLVAYVLFYSILSCIYRFMLTEKGMYSIILVTYIFRKRFLVFLRNCTWARWIRDVGKQQVRISPPISIFTKNLC